MTEEKNPLGFKVLMIYDGVDENNANARKIQALKSDLEEKDIQVVIAQCYNDAAAVIRSDPTVECVLLNLDDDPDHHFGHSVRMLKLIRSRNENVPVFLLACRTVASGVPADILDKVNDFIWILEDTSDFIAGRIVAAIRRYREYILPPMFKALVNFSKVHEYSWHTPGHTGGTAFLKSAVGRSFFNFFKEPVFRSDLSISVGELGSLLDHSGPIGESEKYISRVFGSDRSYTVTNGSSTSNRVILMSSVTRNQVALVDRNCHKSVEQGLTMCGAVPSYLIPSRNQYGIIGPIKPERLTKEAVAQSVSENALVKDGVNKQPVHAVVTNSTYDGLCYNINRVKELLGESVDRLHFDEAWYGYARFNPLYCERFAMCGDIAEYDRSGPTVFSTQSTHKLLAAFSQASMIHIREGRKPIDHKRFNESFMMHASTSPFYPIIATNDISAAMMDGPQGQALTEDSIREAIAFRQTVAHLHAEMKGKGDWFFDIWQPDYVLDAKSGQKVPFYEAEEEQLANDPSAWYLRPNDEWHGFGDIEEGYCMLDPIKVTVVTPGMGKDAVLEGSGIPAALLTSYLDNRGIVVEKTQDFTVLFLFSLGVTKGKWGTLLNALFAFKKDYDNNTPLERVLPKVVADNPERYLNMGLKDLADEMFAKMKELQMTKALAEGFAVLPKPDMTPVEAYEQLVLNNIESVTLNEASGRTVATGIVPYPPGIPLLMPGENAGDADGPLLGYLKALEAFDRYFPGFAHDTHGVERDSDGNYEIMCLKR